MLEAAAAGIAQHARDVTEETLAHASSVSLSAFWVTLLMLTVGVAASVWSLGRFVLQPLGTVIASLDRLAQGDFQSEIALRRDDELGGLASSARRIREHLGELLRRIVSTAQDLDQAGARLADLSDQNQ